VRKPSAKRLREVVVLGPERVWSLRRHLIERQDAAAPHPRRMYRCQTHRRGALLRLGDRVRDLVESEVAAQRPTP
jgi:hypothetical protein